VEIIRALIAGLGAIVGFVGFMMLSMEWMNGATNSSTSWTVFIIGAVMWVQGLPLVISSIKDRIREAVKKERGK
jgi:hypothetical protein